MENQKRKDKIRKEEISTPLTKEEKIACEIELIKSYQEINKMNHTNYVIILLSVFAIMVAVTIGWVSLKKDNPDEIPLVIIITGLAFLFFVIAMLTKYIKPNRMKFQHSQAEIENKYKSLGVNVKALKKN